VLVAVQVSTLEGGWRWYNLEVAAGDGGLSVSVPYARLVLSPVRDKGGKLRIV
jgi:hypothetical protein